MTVRVSDVPPAVKGAIRLRIQLESESVVAVQLNGCPVDLERSPEVEERFGLVWLTGLVPQEALRNGANQVTVRLSEAAATVQLTGVEVLVQHSETQ